jgi:hypothetical protein
VLWAAYLLLAVILTWPTAGQLTTHLPGDGGDDPAIAWNLWWIKYALLNEGQNLFQTDFMFYPVGINLAFYTLTLLNALTALPLTLNLGVVTASNLHLFFTFAAGGYGAFLLVRYLLTPGIEASAGQKQAHLIWFSATIAGGFYTFASNKLFYVALGQFNIASTHWIPFAMLYLLRSHRQPAQIKNSLLAGLFLTLQAWTEVTYASFLLIFFALYWFYLGITRGIIHPSYRRFIPHLRAMLVMGLTFILGFSPILLQMIPDMLAEGDFLVEGSGFAEAFSADLFGFLLPTIHHPVLGHLVTQTDIAGFDKGQHIFIGSTLLVLVLIALWPGHRQPELYFWLFAAVIFALLCLGPIITVNGQATPLPGPFSLLQTLPFFKGNRYPSRYSVMLMLSLSVIAGFGLVKIGSRLRHLSPVPSTQYLVLGLIAGLFFIEHLSLPLPQSDMRVPLPYQHLAAAPDPFTILDIPFAWRNGFRINGALTAQFMFGQFYQTIHQKKLLQGNTSRNPEFKFQYFMNAPVINSLLALETGKTVPPERWARDRAVAAEVLDFFNLNYIVVRPEFSNPIVTPQATIPYIEQLFPVEKIHDEPTIKIYRVIQQPASQSDLLIDTHTPLAPLYFGEGWGLLSRGQPITAQRQEIRLIVPLNTAPQQLTVRMRLPEEARINSRTFYLELNGWQSAPQTITTTWQEFTFKLPAEAIRPGLNDLWLHFDDVTPVPPFSPETPPLDITVLSAGAEVGDFGYIFANGRQISANQRGYNLAIIEPGADIQIKYFDTHVDPAASANLSRAISVVSSSQAGETIIAIAAADETSAKLDAEAVLALQSLGAKGDLRSCFRCSHAIIIQLDKSGRRIIEEWDPLRPVGITTHLGLTEPNIAATIEWLRFER